MKHFKLAILACLTALLITGCGVKQNVQSLNSINATQGLVTGTVKVFINGEDVTNRVGVFFDGQSVGSTLKDLGPSGFFAFNFDEGQHTISRVNYYEGYPTLPFENEFVDISFNVMAGKVNYLGDIVINWEVPSNTFNSSNEGIDPMVGAMLLGPLGAAMSKPKYSEFMGVDVGKVNLSTTYDPDNMAVLFTEKYGSTPDLLTTHFSGSSVANGDDFSPVVEIHEPEVEQVESQLVALKSMFERELITKDEYNQKRRELLDTM